jgi:hypothetical protein
MRVIAALHGRRPLLLRYIFTSIFLSVFVSSIAHADVVDFTQVSIGAQSSFSYQGVTVTGNNATQVSTVAGVGLGISGVGSDGSIDWIYNRFSDSDGNYISGGTMETGTLNLSVDGRINSITLVPYLSIEGPTPLEGVQLRFTSRFTPVVSQCGSWEARRAMGSAAAQTFNMSIFECGREGAMVTGLNTIGINHPEMGNDLRYYEMSQEFPDYTARFGFSIVSLDYTPTQVPEPGTLQLLGLGVVGVALIRRRLQ